MSQNICSAPEPEKKEPMDDETLDKLLDELIDDGPPVKSDMDVFEQAISNFSEFREPPEISTCIEEVDNTQIYKFSDDAKLNLFNGSYFDTGLGEGYRERTLIQTSCSLEIKGTFNTRDLQIENYPSYVDFGQVKFLDKQKSDTLIVENVGLFGSFDTSIVSIRDSSYVDIDIDLTNKSKCAYLLVDTRFNRVRGKINISKSFYSQLNNENKDFLIAISDEKNLTISIEGTPIARYIEKKYGSSNIVQQYSNIKEILSEITIDI